MRFSEGLPLRDYSIPALLLSAPLALLIYVYGRLMRLLGSEAPFDASGIPPNAIVYAFHTDTFASGMADGFRDAIGGTWIGFHGALSYMGSLGFVLRGEPVFRFRRSSQEPRPLQQILEFLAKAEGRIYIRTDAGGPYKKVKPSLIEMAFQSGRPLVAVRHRLSQEFIVNHHSLPWGRPKLVTVASAPLSAETLKKAASREAALQLAQDMIDKL